MKKSILFSLVALVGMSACDSNISHLKSNSDTIVCKKINNNFVCLMQKKDFKK